MVLGPEPLALSYAFSLSGGILKKPPFSQSGGEPAFYMSTLFASTSNTNTTPLLFLFLTLGHLLLPDNLSQAYLLWWPPRIWHPWHLSPCLNYSYV